MLFAKKLKLPFENRAFTDFAQFTQQSLLNISGCLNKDRGGR